ESRWQPTKYRKCAAGLVATNTSTGITKPARRNSRRKKRSRRCWPALPVSWAARHLSLQRSSARSRQLPDWLAVALLVAIRAFHRRCPALTVLCLMAIDAESGGCGRAVEGRLQLGGDRRPGGFGMAIGTRLLRSLQRLLRLRCVMANVAFAGHLQVCRVIELHRTHGSALEQDGCRRSCLGERATR